MDTRIPAVTLIRRSIEKAQDKQFRGNGWGARHVEAWQTSRAEASGTRTVWGFPIVLMVEGWAKQADLYFDRYESVIGDDGVLGPAWESIGRGLLTLLNGELGQLDAGTVDGLIRDILKANGITEE